MKVVLTDGGRLEAGFKGKAPGDCVTRAIALATGLPYLQVYNELNAIAQDERPCRGKERSNARTGVHRETYDRLMKQLGWLWTPTMGIGQRHRVRLRDVPATGKLVVTLNEHLTCVIGGVVYDNHDPSQGGERCVFSYWKEEES